MDVEDYDCRGDMRRRERGEINCDVYWIRRRKGKRRVAERRGGNVGKKDRIKEREEGRRG